MSDGGGLAHGRPTYDPSEDPENFPLVFWEGATIYEGVFYSPITDGFVATVRGAVYGDDAHYERVELRVGLQALRYIYDVGHRPGDPRRLYEVAALRYFDHEAFLRGLRPC